jgi:hypothetical protein
VTKKPIESVLEENTSRLMSLNGVVGIAVSRSQGKLCIKVFVNQKTDELQHQIPSSLGGYPVLVEQRGQFRALSA